MKAKSERGRGKTLRLFKALARAVRGLHVGTRMLGGPEEEGQCLQEVEHYVETGFVKQDLFFLAEHFGPEFEEAFFVAMNEGPADD
jgi:hypothetical protein